MTAGDGRRRGIRLLALSIFALSLVVVAVSAYLRLDAAGLGCSPWPACYGGILGGEPPALHYGLMRLVHRVAASTALLLALILAWRCLRPAPLLPAARHAVLLLLLMLALAGLGFLSADPRRALVGFLNLVGGLGLVSFSWRVAIAADTSPTTRRPASLLLDCGLVLLTAAVLLGAWIGASYAAAACPTLPFCAAGGESGALAALDPLRRPTAAAMPGDAGAALLHHLHRGSALLAVLLLTTACIAAIRAKQRRGAAIAAIALLSATFAAGAAAIASDLALLPTLAHGIAAALLLAAVASLRRR